MITNWSIHLKINLSNRPRVSYKVMMRTSKLKMNDNIFFISKMDSHLEPSANSLIFWMKFSLKRNHLNIQSQQTWDLIASPKNLESLWSSTNQSILTSNAIIENDEMHNTWLLVKPKRNKNAIQKIILWTYHGIMM